MQLHQQLSSCVGRQWWGRGASKRQPSSRQICSRVLLGWAASQVGEAEEQVHGMPAAERLLIGEPASHDSAFNFSSVHDHARYTQLIEKLDNKRGAVPSWAVWGGGGVGAKHRVLGAVHT